ncbi:hypothetical protein UFOVP199_10 [uncultured Caudovirales phage]|uniref:Uncharacterized protein n=1 Tax=uncultured Caudovirales phage TaxID=2100421 RepID=A0A6J7WIH5_9CAUD|nr:hypothetical protein UFOVP199_10 [uncultured Caudovirales phage]
MPNTVKISCSCRVCSINAKTLDKCLPLMAMATPQAAAAGTNHALVELAHHPILGSHQNAVIPVEFTYRELLNMQEFIEDFEFDASEATTSQWNRVIKEALAKGWQPNG